jgi:predicted DNA-binding transcriptional regulator AlpA
VGRESLRALVAGHLRGVNTLIVGATVEELHDILAALAASQSHAMAHLLKAADMAVADRRPVEYLTARDVSEMTGVSRTWLYDHGVELGIAVRPRGLRGLRFPRFAVEQWMETRERGQG